MTSNVYYNYSSNCIDSFEILSLYGKYSHNLIIAGNSLTPGKYYVFKQVVTSRQGSQQGYAFAQVYVKYSPVVTLFEISTPGTSGNVNNSLISLMNRTEIFIQGITIANDTTNSGSASLVHSQLITALYYSVSSNQGQTLTYPIYTGFAPLIPNVTYSSGAITIYGCLRDMYGAAHVSKKRTYSKRHYPINIHSVVGALGQRPANASELTCYTNIINTVDTYLKKYYLVDSNSTWQSLVSIEQLIRVIHGYVKIRRQESTIYALTHQLAAFTFSNYSSALLCQIGSLHLHDTYTILALEANLATFSETLLGFITKGVISSNDTAACTIIGYIRHIFYKYLAFKENCFQQVIDRISQTKLKKKKKHKKKKKKICPTQIYKPNENRYDIQVIKQQAIVRIDFIQHSGIQTCEFPSGVSLNAIVVLYNNVDVTLSDSSPLLLKTYYDSTDEISQAETECVWYQLQSLHWSDNECTLALLDGNHTIACHCTTMQDAYGIASRTSTPLKAYQYYTETAAVVGLLLSLLFVFLFASIIYSSVYHHQYYKLSLKGVEVIQSRVTLIAIIIFCSLAGLSCCYLDLHFFTTHLQSVKVISEHSFLSISGKYFLSEIWQLEYVAILYSVIVHNWTYVYHYGCSINTHCHQCFSMDAHHTIRNILLLVISAWTVINISITSAITVDSKTHTRHDVAVYVQDCTKIACIVYVAVGVALLFYQFRCLATFKQYFDTGKFDIDMAVCTWKRLNWLPLILFLWLVANLFLFYDLSAHKNFENTYCHHFFLASYFGLKCLDVIVLYFFIHLYKPTEGWIFITRETKSKRMIATKTLTISAKVTKENDDKIMEVLAPPLKVALRDPSLLKKAGVGQRMRRQSMAAPTSISSIKPVPAAITVQRIRSHMSEEKQDLEEESRSIAESLRLSYVQKNFLFLFDYLPYTLNKYAFVT
ncbi:hypothetical protein RFI_31941 [Reticulomyxa filosa]|uniref:Uncharacterized protein n=1 Tax=Reticulomyxa filosa TaxID=46433 RepID=X6LV26_RETFI|nr:hypothetical protein RFI_31941 [Reticulomyxa filosa]|eukprot:ETO05454.1 hypothetical protein RFI_31941 [Reticulomyxa filosa]